MSKEGKGKKSLRKNITKKNPKKVGATKTQKKKRGKKMERKKKSLCYLNDKSLKNATQKKKAVRKTKAINFGFPLVEIFFCFF